VLTASEGEDWERGGLYKSWILEHESVFYLFYNAKNVTEGDWREQTGIARSNDLRTWRRHPANPVVRNGPPGSFDELFASDPCGLRGDEGWYLFYFGVSRDGHARDGVARSADLLEWSQDHVPILDAGAPGAVDDRHAHKPCVIARDGALYHFYCAVGDRAAGSGTAGGVEHYQSRGISYAVWGGAPG
jgi:predicted GH43/DUF377 family glycosyl hydrolase